MKKKWIAFLLALSMIFSTVGVQATDGTLMGWNFAQGGVETVKGQGTFTDMTAKATESYEYEIVGDDGTVATVSVPAILGKVYKLYEPKDTATPVADGTYVIGGISTITYNSNAPFGQVITRKDGNTLGYTRVNTPYLEDETPEVIEMDLPNAEWKFTYQATTDGIATYAISTLDETQWLSVGTSASLSNASDPLNVLDNNVFDKGVAIGKGAITENKYINYNETSSALGLWNANNDKNSTWYLYALNYVILDESIATVTEDVGAETDYTSDSWAAYEEALEATETVYETQEAAITAYDALVAAVEALETASGEENEEILPDGITKETGEEYYKLIPVTVGGTEIEPGTYVIVNSRFYRAMSATPRGSKLDFVTIFGGHADGYNNNEVAPERLTADDAGKIETYKLAWEITEGSSAGKYYIKNLSTGTYLTLGDGTANVSSESGVDTSFIGRTGYEDNDAEQHTGAVQLKQSSYYLNMHGGSGGAFGGYGTAKDGGGATYLYKKTQDVTYVVDTSNLEAAIAEYENLTEVEFSSEGWTAFQSAMDNAEAVLEAENEYATLEEANTYLGTVNAAKEALELAAKNKQLPEGITKTTKGLYSLVQIGEGETVQPGTYLILSSRFHRALLPENNTANNKLYLQILSQPADITNEVPPSTIKVTEAQMAAYKLDWEISKDGDNYYIKNAGTNGYLRFTAGEGTVSATLGEDAKVATTINRYTGSEAHNGSVVIGQSGQYLNMYNGNAGNYGGYNQNYDGGSAHYLYVKQADVQLYEVDTAALQNLVTEYTNLNLQSANYTADSWAAYNTALTSARTLLNQDHSFEALGDAVADKASVDSALAALQSAKAALVKVKYTMQELYEEICKANAHVSGSEDLFLYSEEVYTPASGIAYREALKAARGTFATSEEAVTALENLKNAVKGLTLKENMKSCFPEITWTITEDIRIDGAANYVEDLPYINTSPLDVNNDGTVDFATYEALDWEWADIEKLVNDEERKVELVWTKDDKGISYAHYGQEKDSDFKTANVYKISGVFEWPEGYDINKTTVVLDSKNDFYYRDIYEYLDSENLEQYFPLGQVFPIDDDAYVVFWAEADKNSKPTVDTINDSLAFWAGTSGKGAWTQRGNTNNDWGRTETATFIEWNLQGERTFRYSYPNTIGTTEITDVSQANGQVQDWNYEYVAHSDGWYTLTDTSAINSVLRNNNDSIAAGTKVHIDLYVMNNAEVSSIDELEIELFTSEDPDVTVNYYLNSVENGVLLGSEQILNVAVGTEITVLPGVRAGQLNSYKAEAIYQAGYKDVTDGVQQGTVPYTVVNSEDNVINIVYTIKDAKTVYLTAPSKEVAFNGSEQVLNDAVVVTEDGVEATLITEGADAGKGAYRLADGNIIYGVFAQATGTNPGEYENAFVNEASIGVKDEFGDNVTNSYAIVKTPGTLTITEYEAPAVVATYDFAVTNNYVLGEMLSDFEAIAVDVTLEEGTNVALNSGILSYKPDAAGASETVELTLKFNDSYSVAKEVKFVPASTVLYGEQFMTKAESSVWTAEGTAADYTVGDNATSVYGYTGDIKDATYTENSVLKATLDVNGDSGITGLTAKTDAMTFTFTGTGFDLLSACGPDTGMIVAKVTNQNGEVVGSYLVDTYFTGDLGTNAIISSADAATYQVPVVRNLDLPYGTYTVTVHGYLLNTSGALRTFGMDDATIPTEDLVMTMLEDLEMYDVDVDDVEISFMNEDSVLNGGSGNLYAESAFGGFALTREGEGDSAQAAAGKDSVATVYVDGFRVYEPLTKEQEATDYVAAEQQTNYRSVYDFIKNSVNDLGANSVVYIEYDGNTGTSSIADYKIQGPQNEVYLTGGNSVAFAMEGYNAGDVVQIGAKLVTPGAKLSSDNGATETQLYATEMYYPVTVQTVNGMNCVVIQNTGDDDTVLSISTLKVSENIGIYASAEIGQQIIKTPSQGGDDVETDEIPTLKVTAPEEVEQDRAFSIYIEAAKDVTGVDVIVSGGVPIDLTAENEQAVLAGVADTYRYSHTLRAKAELVENGIYEFTVIAHKEDGTTETVAFEVAVQTQAAVQ